MALVRDNTREVGEAAPTRALLPLLVPLFVVVASVGLVSLHSAALALAPHPDVAGSASALVGTSQFLLAGLISPLGGLGGTASALPMALTMAVVAVVSLVVVGALTRAWPVVA